MPEHKIKFMLRAFAKGSTSDQREHKNYVSLYRLAPLLLLMLYAVCSVIRLAGSSSSYSSSLVQTTDSFVTEISSELESFKTHISSNLNYLQASEENTAHRCTDLIHGGMVRMNPFRDEGALLCCDRSHNRTDVCYMRGDIRTDANSSSIVVIGAGEGKEPAETIRPYTRKWETDIMSTIDNITLLPMASTNINGSQSKACEKRHSVPGLVFSTGGYTGNLYHEFNDGLIPLFITARRFHGEVVLVVLEYHSWWMTAYRPLLRKLTNYKVVDFSRDRRVHCFSEMIVGLQIHGELTIDPMLMPNGIGIQDFQALLRQGLEGSQLKPQDALPAPAATPTASGYGNSPCSTTKPKITIIIRSKSRVLLNLNEIVKACQRIGFEVQVLKPKRGMPLSEIYEALDSADVMLAVHGAAMTHFLFMRPGSVLIQIVPLGLDWAAETYYGEPARKLGLEYMAYRVAPGESSLSKEYHRRSPVLMDPTIITRQGWWETKRIYLDKQNVRVNIRRFSRVLTKARSHICTSQAQA